MLSPRESKNKQRLIVGIAALSFGVVLWILCFWMFELYSKRQTLSVILFHLGLLSLSVSLSFAVSWIIAASKELFFKIVLISISLTIGLLIVEGVLRIDGRFKTTLEQSGNEIYYSFLRDQFHSSWYWTRPADTALQFPRKEFEFKRTTNELGLSDKPISPKRSDIRILGLGDSFTEGTGVPQDSTWLRRLEEKLNVDSTVRFETVNAGIGGSDPVYAYKLLEDKLLGLYPDIVILSVNSSDITDIAYRGGFARFHKDGTAGRKSPKWEWLYGVSHLVRLVAHNGLQLNHYLVPPEDETAGRKVAVQSLNQVASALTKLGAKHQFTPLFVLHPIIYDFNYPQYLDNELIEFKTFLSANNIPFLDIRDCFREKGIDDFETARNYYWELDRHFNQNGYNLYGDCVVEYISQLNLPATNSTN